jgi:acyl carrier protein
MKRAARCVALALCEVEQIDTATFEPTSRLVKDLRMTDLEPVEMVMLLEKDFGIRIPDSDAERLETVSEWVRYIYDRAFSHAEQKEGATRGGTTRDE